MANRDKANKIALEEQFDLGKFTIFADCLNCGTQRCNPAEPEWREGCKCYKDFITMNITDEHVAFWGGPFSNFYPCKIHVDSDWDEKPVDLTFKSSEQYFMWQKAMYFGDEETAEEILKAKTPKEAKALGRQVNGFDEKEWEVAREAAMWNAVLLKFRQNEDLKKYLTNRLFVFKKFVEGSPVDCIWGVGLRWDDPRIDDESNWKGLNLLGKTLNKVQDNILNEEAKFPDVKEVPEPEA